MEFDKGKQIGFIAQEVEKVFPELVDTDKDGFKSVKYDKFTSIIVEGIKALNEKFETASKNLRLELQTKHAEQEKEISDLRKTDAEQKKGISDLQKKIAEQDRALKELKATLLKIQQN